MSNTSYSGNTIYIPSTTTGGSTYRTSPIYTYSTSSYYQDEIYQELKLSNAFDIGDFVKVKSSTYLYDKHVLYGALGLVHACYNEFCIVIFDFKFYKIKADFLLDAFDE